MAKRVDGEVVALQRRDFLDRLSGDDRQLVAAFCDRAGRVARRGQPEFSGFLDPGQRALLSDYHHLWPVRLVSYGGYDDAERQVVAVVDAALDEDDADLSTDLAWPLRAVRATGNFQFAKVSHRDYLGSLLSLGLRRELFGDILVLPDGCQVLVHEHALSFVLANWAAVGAVGIQLAQIDLAELTLPERERVVRTATVATLRLDAVLAAAYGLARSRAVDLIKAGRVKLNYRLEQRPDRQLTAGAMLSLAGSGRAELLTVGGASKSGRIFIEVARWL